MASQDWLHLLLALFTATFVSACAQTTDGTDVSQCAELPQLQGSAGIDIVEGGDQSECLLGLGGKDMLSGGAGDDILIGGPQADALFGGIGNDTYVVSLGDHLDVIHDPDGQNVIRLTQDILLENIRAAWQDNVLVLQIESGDAWTYLMIGNGIDGNETRIQQIILADVGTFTVDELLRDVPNNVSSVSELTKDIKTAAPVAMQSNEDTDSALKSALEVTLRSQKKDQSLCVSPMSSPRPNSVTDNKGIWPGAYHVIFYGDPVDDRASLQRRQYAALAKVGLFDVGDAISPGGDSGKRYTLTPDGWAYKDKGLCFVFGTPAIKAIDRYQGTGQMLDHAELVQVSFTIASNDIELWATDPDVRANFPVIEAYSQGKTMEAVIFRDDTGWLGSSAQGMPIRKSLTPRAEKPSSKELLALEHKGRPGTLEHSQLCIRAPMLGSVNSKDPDSAWSTFSRKPFTGPNAIHYKKAQTELEMLVAIGAMTTRMRSEVDTTGSKQEFLEYRLAPGVGIAKNGLVDCIPVAHAQYDVIRSARTGDFGVTMKGMQRATAMYAWVSDPRFLAQYPEVAAQLATLQPLVAQFDVHPGRQPQVGSIRLPLLE